ncbi:MAG: lyase family protein [Comamonadaceae bacterium]|nr:lyase family protein [Comamonadaceae bacterium]
MNSSPCSAVRADRAVAARRPLCAPDGARCATCSPSSPSCARACGSRSQWLIGAGAELGLPELAAARRRRRRPRCDALVGDFSHRRLRARSRRSRRAPTTTSRRSSTGIKRARRRRAGAAAAAEFIHFACTSEDINNVAHALMLARGARCVLLPALRGASRGCASWRTRTPTLPMLSRTHGQPATPDDAWARSSPTSRCALGSAIDAHRARCR